MRIAALLKQIPLVEELELGPDGRLRREGSPSEMNAYCRRAVSQSVVFAQQAGERGEAARCTFVTLGPPSAQDVLREAIAWASARGVAADGVLVTDRAFAGSDTLATARALAAVLKREGPFDLILSGRNSLDADTGQVGPQVAELLDLPFVGGIRRVSLAGGVLRAHCEQDDGTVEAEVRLPAIVSTAERLTEPCKVPPPARADVPAAAIRVVTAAELGSGPWGQAGSRTSVGRVRMHEVQRARVRLGGHVDEQAVAAVKLLLERGALEACTAAAQVSSLDAVPESAAAAAAESVVVAVESDRSRVARELLGAAARLGAEVGRPVVAFTFTDADPAELSGWGADAVVTAAAPVAEDAATALGGWAAARQPWAILLPSTAWGREVGGRVACRLDAGLIGDAVGFETDAGRLVAWKPAFGGQLVAAITATSPTQMATVRVGVLPTLAPRASRMVIVENVAVERRGRVTVLGSEREDDLEVLADATAVVGVGNGVAPDSYDKLKPLLDALGAELGATRRVTDAGWLPHDRQIGITGRSIAPQLFVSIGASGRFNHMVGVRAAPTVLAINSDPAALVFDAADIGIVADWKDVVPALARALNAVRVG